MSPADAKKTHWLNIRDQQLAAARIAGNSASKQPVVTPKSTSAGRKRKTGNKKNHVNIKKKTRRDTIRDFDCECGKNVKFVQENDRNRDSDRLQRVDDLLGVFQRKLDQLPAESRTAKAGEHILGLNHWARYIALLWMSEGYEKATACNLAQAVTGVGTERLSRKITTAMTNIGTDNVLFERSMRGKHAKYKCRVSTGGS